MTNTCDSELSGHWSSSLFSQGLGPMLTYCLLNKIPIKINFSFIKNAIKNVIRSKMWPIFFLASVYQFHPFTNDVPTHPFIYAHYSDVIMGATASQITSLPTVFSTVYSDADQRKHQSSVSLAFVRGIHRGPVKSPHKWPVMRKMFPFDDVIMITRSFCEEDNTKPHQSFLCDTQFQSCWSL